MKIPNIQKTFRCLLGLLLSATLSAQAIADVDDLYLITNAAGNTISYVDLKQGVTDQVEVGIAPFDMALDQHGRAYVSTAEGVAIVDIEKSKRMALIPYQTDVGRTSYGEYRKGGMGIAVTADGSRVYAGIYLGNRPSLLEIIDTIDKRVINSVPLGIRPFQLLLSPDQKTIYSIDHDSYSVTTVDLETLQTKTLKMAPLGYAAFDKPHYAVIDVNGNLLLPVQGKVLAKLNPKTGRISTTPLTADTHQHGIALSSDKSSAFIVGTGPAGGASSDPSLSIIHLQSGIERLIPLDREHEQIALSKNDRWAILTGGNSFTNGWNGITVIDLKNGNQRHLKVPNQPLGIHRIGQK